MLEIVNFVFDLLLVLCAGPLRQIVLEGDDRVAPATLLLVEVTQIVEAHRVLTLSLGCLFVPVDCLTVITLLGVGPT